MYAIPYVINSLEKLKKKSSSTTGLHCCVFVRSPVKTIYHKIAWRYQPKIIFWILCWQLKYMSVSKRFFCMLYEIARVIEIYRILTWTTM